MWACERLKHTSVVQDDVVLVGGGRIIFWCHQQELLLTVSFTTVCCFLNKNYNAINNINSNKSNACCKALKLKLEELFMSKLLKHDI